MLNIFHSLPEHYDANFSYFSEAPACIHAVPAVHRLLDTCRCQCLHVLLCAASLETMAG